MEIIATVEGIGDIGVTATLSSKADTRRFVVRCESKSEPNSVDMNQSSDEDMGTGNKSGK